MASAPKSKASRGLKIAGHAAEWLFRGLLLSFSASFEFSTTTVKGDKLIMSGEFTSAVDRLLEKYRIARKAPPHNGGSVIYPVLTARSDDFLLFMKAWYIDTEDRTPLEASVGARSLTVCGLSIMLVSVNL